MSDRIERAARRWAETGGRTADPGDAVDAAGQGRGDVRGGGHADDEAADESPTEKRWLDRATGAVEARLGRLGHAYLAGLVRSFERRWQEIESQRKAAPAAAGTG